MLLCEVQQLMCTKRRGHTLKDKTVFHYTDKADKKKNNIYLQKSLVNVWQSIIKPVTLAKMLPICERLFKDL